MNIDLLQETRADEGIYAPLIERISEEFRINLRVIHSHDQLWEPDWLIVLGDRRAMLTATIEAAYRGIPIAHIQGGDRTGTIDEPARHAITRFANLHFPCTQQSADRLIKMGENPWRIKIVGPLGIYAMKDAHFMSKIAVCGELGLDPSREIVLVIQHPVSTQIKQAGEQMKATLEAIKGFQTVVIHPNTDPGSEDMIGEIEACDWIHKFKSLPHLQFLSLLKCCDVIVGNSSCGLYEAPLFGIPAVNIGTRQEQRERGLNIWDADYSSEQISERIKDAVSVSKIRNLKMCNPFKVDLDGVKVIMETLLSTPIDERLLQKHLTY